MHVSLIYIGPTCMDPTPNMPWCRFDVNQSNVRITHSKKSNPIISLKKSCCTTIIFQLAMVTLENSVQK
jgi:hypothetical protein